MSEQEQLDAITKLLIDAGKPARDRLDMEYDGINGTPPDLIPKRYQNDFIRIRARLLDARGYSHDRLMVWLDKYRIHFLIELDDEHVKEFYRQPSNVDPNGFIPLREYPNGKPIDWYAFTDEIGLLAWLRWLVFDLYPVDEAEAKKQLDIGFSVTDVSDKGHAAQTAMSNNSKDFVVKTAQSDWDNESKKGRTITTVPVMAKRMLKKLNEEKEKKEYKNIYFIPKDSVMPRWINQAIKDGKLVRPDK